MSNNEAKNQKKHVTHLWYLLWC